MSFLVVANSVKNKNIVISYSKREVPSPSEFISNETETYIFTGEFFENSMNVLTCGWENFPEKLQTKKGNFSIIKIDHNTRTIYFATSKCGNETLYYYYKEKCFVLSDDFWEIVNYIKPNYEDLNVNYIKEQTIIQASLLGETYIEGLNIVKAANLGIYQMSSNALTINKYWSFRYELLSDYSCEEAVDTMDLILNRAMANIREMVGDKQFAVGLSGGLDSRIIPYYAKNNGMRVKSFILGVKRPHNIFLSRDHRNARKLAKIFHIDHTEIEWKPKELENKIKTEIRNAPVIPVQFFLFETDNIPEFDVLLTGASGMIVGSEMPLNIDTMTIQDLVQFIIEHDGVFKAKSTFKRRLSDALKYVFNISYTPTDFKTKWVNKVIDENIQKSVRDKIRNFIDVGIAEGKNIVDIYEDYFYNCLGYRNLYGAFESFLGTKRCFSIYIPHMFDEVLRWDLSFLKNRKVLRSLISKKMSAVSGIKAQNYMISPSDKNSIINRIWCMLVFVIRGNGSDSRRKYFHKRKCMNMYLNDMMSNSKWFSTIFDLNKKELKGMACNQKELAAQLWKTKRVLDVLENRKYEIYFDNCSDHYYI